MMEAPATRAARVISRCGEVARITDVPCQTTRLFLSPATREAHTLLMAWMREAGLHVRIDDAGNLRATRAGSSPESATLLLFSHIDTVPNAGAFDGVLGVVLALAVMEELGSKLLPFAIEVIAFSEEEGVRFGFPFLSSLAVTGQLTDQHLLRTDAHGSTLAEVFRDYGLQPEHIAQTCPLPTKAFASVEIHIEQGPVLEANDRSLAVVEAVAGQSRLKLTFTGQANHAGTTPMALRQDALAAAAQFIVEAERYAANHEQLVATVGQIEALPGATNIIPGKVHLTLDVRHPNDASRQAAVDHLLTSAEQSAARRAVQFVAAVMSEQKAIPLNRDLALQLANSAERAGYSVGFMFSGAGHDAMILAPHVPTTMLFLRSPGGLSHHPDESVREQDVEAALATMIDFILHLRA